MLLGLVADTHGYFDPRLPAALRGVDLILHAGDVGSVSVIEALQALAPTSAVEGNNDVGIAGLELPRHLSLDIEGRRLQLVHQRPHALEPQDFDIVVFGHSHKALAQAANGTLWINPGAAGRRGFHRLQTVALLRLERGRQPSVEIVALGERLR